MKIVRLIASLTLCVASLPFLLAGAIGSALETAGLKIFPWAEEKEDEKTLKLRYRRPAYPLTPHH